MQNIIPTLKEKPDYVYVVDEETAKNIKISLLTPSNGLYLIPKKFKDCLQYFINLTIFKKNKSIRILKIKPLATISNGGLTYLDNTIPNWTNFIIGEIPFGGIDKYDELVASNQLIYNLNNIKKCTNISTEKMAYIVTEKSNNDDIKVLIHPIQLTPYVDEPRLPPRITSKSPLEKFNEKHPSIIPKPSSPANNSGLTVISELGKKYLYKYLKYKQKYLNAQLLYSKELKGGALVYFIYCPVKIYELIQNLFPASNRTFKNRDCFFLLLGPNSYYDENGKKENLMNCWSGINENKKIPDNYKIFMTIYDGNSDNWIINYADIKTN